MEEAQRRITMGKISANKVTPTKGKIDPFKTKKTKALPAANQDTVSPPSSVAEAIDSFREAQDQYKHFEGEMTIFKDQVVSYSHQEFARRLQSGMKGSFRILGNETSVTYVVMDSSAGLTEEDLAEFTRKWGEDAAEALIARDYGSVKFDPSVLETNYEAVVEALQVLPEHVLSNLFKPMLMKATKDAAETVRRMAKSPEQIHEMLRDLKIRNYIK